MIVVDASALVDALSPQQRDLRLDRRLRSADSLHAPHLVDVEVANGLRRLTARRIVSDDRARDALLDLDALQIVRYPHGALLDRAWELRHSLSIHDAVYIALAELLGAPLVTCDARLARAQDVHAEIELFAAAA